MKYLILAFASVLFGCDAPAFNSDARQMLALQNIEHMLPHKSTGFAIEGFSEDTITPSDTTLAKKLTRYNFQITYTDSTGTLVRTQANALFAPNGTSILQAQIIDHP